MQVQQMRTSTRASEIHMSKTWRGVPVGHPKDPRPPEKGGHKNIYKEALEEEFFDSDEEFLADFELEFNDDWDDLYEEN